MTATAFMSRARRCGLTFAEVKAALSLICTGITIVQIESNLRSTIHTLQSTTAEMADTLAKAGITLREEVPS